jgi:hypothetical protein
MHSCLPVCTFIHNAQWVTQLLLLLLQSDANEKLNELEEQLQQIKDQIKVGRCAASSGAPSSRGHAAPAFGEFAANPQWMLCDWCFMTVCATASTCASM